MVRQLSVPDGVVNPSSAEDMASAGGDRLSRLARSLDAQFAEDLFVKGPSDESRASSPDRSIEIRNKGIPSWTALISQRPSEQNAQEILIETCIDVSPRAIQGLDEDSLFRLSANENLGLRGVSIIAVIQGSQRILRMRSTFLTQTSATRDEEENMAIDLMTCLRGAQTLEDRITGCSLAGQFSFEVYAARYEQPGRQVVRYTTESSSVFAGSTERVFGQVCEILSSDFSFKVHRMATQTAIISMPGADLQIVGKIPDEIPMFTCSVPLVQLNDALRFQDRQIWAILNELNGQVEHGHFEFNPLDRVLSFTSWKHLTNDLRHSSFDHVVLSALHAFTKAQNLMSSSPDRVQTPTAELFVEYNDDFLNDDEPPPSGKIEIPKKAF